MTETADRTESVFAAALELPGEARAAYLDEACAADPALRVRIEALLRAHQKAGHLLDRPPAAGWESTGAYVGPSENPGTVVAGRYKLLEQIGEGGMGTVWVAEQTQPVKRKIALKLIKTGMDSRSVLARFEAERQALALMDHPHIAKVLDGGLTETGRPYFVMEYVKGVPITEYCDATRLGIADRLALFVQVCSAVQHAHQKGIIHRDLKPSNILVAPYDDKPVPKVIDFGLAKAMHQSLTEKTLHTAHETVLGTPLYMSPEQAQLNNLDVDTRSDIYALGVLLYELLTGTTPLEKQRFKEAAWDEVRRMIREEEPPRPSQRLSSTQTLPSLAACRHTEPVALTKLLRGELDWIVMKALEKDRTRRYETANGFALDVQRYLAGEPVLAVPPSAGYRLRKFARKHRAALTTAAAIALLLVAGVAASTWQAVRATLAERVALTAEAQAQQERNRATQAEVSARTERDIAVKERARADQEATVAKAVSDFLTNDLLRQADSIAQADRQFESDPDVKVRTLLDRAAKGIEGKFRDQPMAAAGVHRAIGLAYWGLGKYSQAVTHLTRAADLHRAALGPDHPDTLTTLTALVQAYRFADRNADAVALGELVHEQQSRRLGPDHPDTLKTLYLLSQAYQGVGRTEDGLTLLEQVRDRRTRTLGPDHPDTLKTLHNLAIFYQGAGRTADAIAVGEQVRDGRTRTLGPDHPETLLSISVLAQSYKSAGRTADAVALYEEVGPKIRRVLGPRHPWTISIVRQWMGALKAAGQYARTSEILGELLAVERTLDSADDLRLASTLASLGSALQLAGRPVEALPRFEEALNLRRAKLGPDHGDTLAVLGYLADTYHDAGRPVEAIALHEEALKLRRAKVGPDHLETLSSLGTLAEAYRAAGRFADAVSLFEELIRRRTANQGASHLQVASAKVGLGQTLLSQRKYAEAESLLREGLAVREKALPGSGAVASAQCSLGAALAGQQKYAEAEPLLVAGYEGLKRASNLPNTYQNRPTLPLERLVQLYEAWGKPDEAAKWQTELEAVKVQQPPKP